MPDAPELAFFGGEARITLRRPETGNALTLPDVHALRQAIETAAAREEVRVLRICAQGGTFCAGRAAPPAGSEPPRWEQVRPRLIEPILALYRALHTLDIVTLAQVQGDAHGLGCALVAACDLAVASEGARFSLPEMAKDMPPTLALSVVARRVAPKEAAHLVLGLAEWDAARALASGLVGEAVPHDRLQARCDALAAQLAARDALALATVKRFLRAAYAPDFEPWAELAAASLAGAFPAIRERQARRTKEQ
jgi:enoyl-CoA hydratase/carnithine racemase